MAVGNGSTAAMGRQGCFCFTSFEKLGKLFLVLNLCFTKCADGAGQKQTMNAAELNVQGQDEHLGLNSVKVWLASLLLLIGTILPNGTCVSLPRVQGRALLPPP